MKIEYFNKIGNIQYKTKEKRKVLQTEFELEGDIISATDYSSDPLLIQALCNALWAIPETRDTTPHHKLTFNSNDCVIRLDNRIITPDFDLSGESQETRVFAETIYSFDPDPETGEGRYAEIWRLSQLEDEPDVPVTETVDVYDAEGKNIVDQIEVPVTEEAEEIAIVKVEGQLRKITRPVERQKIRKGRKVSDSDRRRLAELKAKE